MVGGAVSAVSTAIQKERAAERGRLSGDRVRVPIGRSAGPGVGTSGGYQLARLPTADEQAGGVWPDLDELEGW